LNAKVVSEKKSADGARATWKYKCSDNLGWNNLAWPVFNRSTGPEEMTWIPAIGCPATVALTLVGKTLNNRIEDH